VASMNVSTAPLGVSKADARSKACSYWEPNSVGACKERVSASATVSATSTRVSLTGC
jgi:hypothetical protein